MTKAIILAGGKGKRMNSDLPKVLHQINGQPLIHYVLELVEKINLDQNNKNNQEKNIIDEKIVVVGYQKEKVQSALKNRNCSFVWQREQLGTGHAVMMAQEKLADYNGDVLILYGDVPGLKVETMKRLIGEHQEREADITILTAVLPEAGNYGRMLRDRKGKVLGIKEAKDANPEELQIKEVNSGIYVVNSSFLLSALGKLKNDNLQKEYYLTDIVGIAQCEGRKIQAVRLEDAQEIKGVNTPEELAELEEWFRKKLKVNI